MSEADGWIEWNGGECPVAKGEYYQVRFRDKDERSGCWPSGYRWEHIGTDGDIIAYRIVQPEQAHAMSHPQAGSITMRIPQGEPVYTYSTASDQIEQQTRNERARMVLNLIPMGKPMTAQIPNVDLLEKWLAEARADRDALSAELAARTELWEGIEFGLREENRKLRCEIDRLRKEVMPNANDTAEIVGQHAVAGAASAKTRALCRHGDWSAECLDCTEGAYGDRLRKETGDGSDIPVAIQGGDCGVGVGVRGGDRHVRHSGLAQSLTGKEREDATTCDGSHMVGETYSHCPQHPKSRSLAVMADTLDHRLGTPQPEGEPVAPMSGRRWRWMP